MKKMKGVVSLDPPYEVYQDQRARLRHQSLLQDYEDLHKVTPFALPSCLFFSMIVFFVLRFSGSGFFP